jgi:hypothetical protein
MPLPYKVSVTSALEIIALVGVAARSLSVLPLAAL